MKKIITYLCVFLLFISTIFPVHATENVDLGLSAASAILIEASTGEVIYEKDADVQLRPASITKVMTLVLIFDAIESGRIKLDDIVTTSAFAKSMGGSQVFLEEGEQQTVDTMIKCIAIASGNDASVAMAEHISGSETAFVNEMNLRATGLGMNNTNFEDCSGLTDSATHITTARDVVIMSKELLTKYPQIKEYTTIWMENITHVTVKGSSEFGLSNTNKLIKQYEWATGLKTGSTSLAKYCLSATADRNGVELIAVIMAAENYKARFNEAISLLNYGYGICKLFVDDNSDILPDAKIYDGVTEYTPIEYDGKFSYLSTDGTDISNITKEIVLTDKVSAPIKPGETAGRAVYLLDGKEVGSVQLLFKEEVRKAGFLDYFQNALGKYFI